VRRLALAAVVLALPGLSACGGNDKEEAQRAATRYVSELGQRDGPGTCAQMTDELQAQFTRAVVQANPQFKGRSCERIMQVALDAIPSEQLKLFADAEIRGMKIDGDAGTFRYTLPATRRIPNEITVDGRVAKEDGDWKVSCCVPGQRGAG
jgi:hypothetical protein